MTSADAQFFWANHPGGETWAQRYAETASADYREWAVDAIAGAHSVLDLGCHCGPLLYRLKAVGITAMGIDINAIAVYLAKQQGLTAVIGAVPEVLTRIPDRSFDVVTSTYCLAYLDPVDLDEALFQALRIAKRSLVLIEPTAGPGVLEDVYEDHRYVEWRHDYVERLARIVEQRFPGRLHATLTCWRKQSTAAPELNALVTAELTWPN